MNRLVTLCFLVAWASAASASTPPGHDSGSGPTPVSALSTPVPQGELRGTVLDERGRPLGGAVVSAVGGSSAFAISDHDGTFVLPRLAVGPYLLRAHLPGYIPPLARLVQVSATSSVAPVIALTRRTAPSDPPRVLQAGVGASGAERDSPPADTDDRGEVTWRLRHLRRSVLKEALPGAVASSASRPFLDDAVAGIGRAVDASLRQASGWLADLPLSGQFLLLTASSFDHPQDLFSPSGALQGVTYASLRAPASGGEWAVRGGAAQGDLVSWIVDGSYVRRVSALHRYEAGFSYGTQRNLGGSTSVLAVLPEGSRSVGAVHAYDDWSIGANVRVRYGAKYARYDYLNDGLFSPTVAITLTPAGRDGRLRFLGSLSRQQLAPGAEEFLPPSTGLWMPPERTFSSATPRTPFAPERLDHLELSVERRWMGELTVGARAFTERVTDQVVTMFGVGGADTAPGGVDHYTVAAAGDFDARGWGVRVSRAVADGLRASVDYTQTEADWQQARTRPSSHPEVGLLARAGIDRTHDLATSVEGELPLVATRVLAVYRLNSGFADPNTSLGRHTGARFDLQINQALPFMNFTSTQWEMLVAVRNLFKEESPDGPASTYDELLVVHPPRRVVGGLTVRF